MEVIDDSKLLPAQKQAVTDIVINGKNVLLLGGPGTGKTTTLLSAIDALEKAGKKRVILLSPTKIAALNIGGSTIDWFLHHWTNEDKLRHYNIVLVIEEISMVTYKKLSQLSVKLCGLMCNPRVFGGVQVIVCGDFRQLPPPESNPDGTPMSFCCFDSSKTKFNALWLSLFPPDSKKLVFLNSAVHILTTIVRQKDGEYGRIVKSIGDGYKGDDLFEILNKTNGAEPDAIRLFPLRKEVDAYNTLALNALPGPERLFVPEIHKGRELLPDLYPIRLKVGCRVMCTTNKIEGIGNGSFGTVTCLEPLKVHFDGLDDEIVVSPIPYKIYGVSRNQSKKRTYGGKMKTAALAPDKPTMELIASAVHIPLILGHAATIHKSQSMTLHSYCIDLANCFSAGMAYVAISRGVSLDKITVKNLKKDHVRVSSAANFIYTTYEQCATK